MSPDTGVEWHERDTVQSTIDELLALQRGIDFLLATQTPDGSWPLLSRSTLDGSPGGVIVADHLQRQLVGDSQPSAAGARENWR